jgi:hypothetical protein
MKLSLELPPLLLEEISPLLEVDFALAQHVLDSKTYADFYRRQRANSRYVILDNGFHELGHPLSIPELKEAAERIEPSVIVAPDWLGKPKETFDAFLDMYTSLGSKFRIGVVLAGSSSEERHRFFAATHRKASLLCLPFREPRFVWFKELVGAFGSSNYVWPSKLHLLGVNTLHELTEFKDFFKKVNFPEERVSVDTAKPIKWAMAGKRFYTEMNLRNAPFSSNDVPKIEKLTPTQKADLLYNIAFLRKYV